MKLKNKLLLTFGLSLFLFAFGIVFMNNKVEAATLTLSGSCSINDAITNANNDDQSGSVNCTAGSGTDTINIPSGTWNLSANTSIVSNIYFLGSGAGISKLDGANTYEGLFCDGTLGTPYDMTVSDLTIQNTNTLNNYGPTAISAGNCNVTVNDAEILNSAADTATNFYSYADDDMQVTINGLYVHDSIGPAIYAFESEGAVNAITIDIDRLTVSNMLVGDMGFGAGIGLASRTGTVNATIRNSTIHPSNVSGLGLYLFSNSDENGDTTVTINLINTTIAKNEIGPIPSSGIYAMAGANSGNSSTLTINSRNTIIAGNTVSSSVSNCASMIPGNGGVEAVNFTSLGNNLSDDATCNFTGTGDQQNASNILSTLGPLQDNGGFNPTMALLSGSPAINTGATISGITTDQRGIARPQGSAYDIGAYEYDGSGSGGNGNGNGSLGGNAVPGVPNTGFRIIMNNPVIVLLISLICSVVILVIARNYKTVKK